MSRVYDEIRADLEPHRRKEEVLLPIIRTLASATSQGAGADQADPLLKRAMALTDRARPGSLGRIGVGGRHGASLVSPGQVRGTRLTASDYPGEC